MRGTIPSLVAMIACLASSGALAAHLPNGVGMSGCDAIVAQVQVDSATAKIEEATEVALSDEFGYSRLGGGGAGRIHESTPDGRSEEHTSELQSLMRISYAVFC